MKMTEKGVLAAKRLKLDSDGESSSKSTSWKIKTILSDELTESTKRCSVYIGEISDPKSISKTLLELCRLLPLKELSHLKRVHKSKVILCSVSTTSEFLTKKREITSVQSTLPNCHNLLQSPTESKLLEADDISTKSILRIYLNERGISDDLIALLLCKSIEIAEVPANIPILRWQYKEAMNEWPCKFHANKMLEDLYNGDMFTNIETEFHLTMMELTRFLKTQLNRNVCGIAIDPRTKSVVAIGFDELQQHPLMHCAMVLIDSVARTQNGGAWTKYLIDANQQIYTNFDDETTEHSLVGVSAFIRELIRMKFPDVKFGAERPRYFDDDTRKIIEMDTNDAAESDNLIKYGPYLCTGYDIYLSREPCIMCSMALTHSRIRRIFFQEKRSNGGICSLVKLQSIKALNHHFQVFHVQEPT